MTRKEIIEEIGKLRFLTDELDKDKESQYIQVAVQKLLEAEMWLGRI